MQSGNLPSKDVLLVQLVYLTRISPGSEFRLYAPSDCSLSDGVSGPGKLTRSHRPGAIIEIIDDPLKWQPNAWPSTISAASESFAVARAVLWSVPGNYLSNSPDQNFGSPFDDGLQPASPFWIIDLGANRVVSAFKSLGEARNHFELRAESFRVALDPTT